MPKTIGVVGMGYVGLTLTAALAQKGFIVHGADVAQPVVDSLSRGYPHIFEPGVAETFATCVWYVHLRGHATAAGHGRCRGDLRVHAGRRRDASCRTCATSRPPPGRWREQLRARHARRGPQHGPGRHEPRRGAAGAPGGLGQRPSGDGAGTHHPGPGAPRTSRAAAGRRWARRREPGGRVWSSSAVWPRSSSRCRAGDGRAREAVEQLPHRPDLRVRQRGRARRRAARARSARGHPRRQPRLPAPGPGQARLRRWRLPVQGSVHHDQQRRPTASRSWSGRPGNSTSTCRCTWPTGSSG